MKKEIKVFATREEQLKGWEYFLEHKVDKKNVELVFRKLIDIELPLSAKNHFEPWDIAYIQKIYEDYSAKWMWKLVKNLAKQAYERKK